MQRPWGWGFWLSPVAPDTNWMHQTHLESLKANHISGLHNLRARFSKPKVGPGNCDFFKSFPQSFWCLAQFRKLWSNPMTSFYRWRHWSPERENDLAPGHRIKWCWSQARKPYSHSPNRALPLLPPLLFTPPPSSPPSHLPQHKRPIEVRFL